MVRVVIVNRNGRFCRRGYSSLSCSEGSLDFDKIEDP